MCVMQTLLPSVAAKHQRPWPGNDTSPPIVNGHKHAPVHHHDDDGYIVPYDIMLSVLADGRDGPQAPCESTKL